jgi:capsular exopolysaccharide synthesis family protein
MGRTFEALLRAEKEEQERWGRGMAEGYRPPPEESNLPAQVVEEYRRLRYRIVNMCTEKRVKALLFVSPTHGEGNSTVLSHFAIVLACEGERVLLVDANLRDPILHQIFRIDLKSGFSELIFQESNLEDMMEKNRLSNLRVITSGNTHLEPFPAIHSKFLDSSIGKMRSKADWVLFDAPPIDSYNDALALAPNMDGVIMVIQAEKTRWEAAQRAKQRMEACHANILGVVLNKGRFYIPGWLYRRL